MDDIQAYIRAAERAEPSGPIISRIIEIPEFDASVAYWRGVAIISVGPSNMVVSHEYADAFMANIV